MPIPEVYPLLAQQLPSQKNTDAINSRLTPIITGSVKGPLADNFSKDKPF